MFTEWASVKTTVAMALISTIILLIIATPLAWKLARSKSKWKFITEAIIALPLILPPTVLGFYLLLAFSPQSRFGAWFENTFGYSLAFSFSGIVIGSVFYSLPFVVQPLQKSFELLGDNYQQAADVLGASRWQTFWQITMPLTKASFITAASLGFAHTMGEFGMVLMLGGNIPGETRVLSIALFEQVEALNYDAAHQLAFSLLLVSFILLAFIYRLNNTNLWLTSRNTHD